MSTLEEGTKEKTEITDLMDEGVKKEEKVPIVKLERAYADPKYSKADQAEKIRIEILKNYIRQQMIEEEERVKKAKLEMEVSKNKRKVGFSKKVDKFTPKVEDSSEEEEIGRAHV